MGRVWLIVFLSMCFTFGASWLWHVSGMNDQANRNKAVDDAVIMDTEQIAHYRDVLQEKGKEAAESYLTITPLTTYGN